MIKAWHDLMFFAAVFVVKILGSEIVLCVCMCCTEQEVFFFVDFMFVFFGVDLKNNIETSFKEKEECANCWFACIDCSKNKEVKC